MVEVRVTKKLYWLAHGRQISPPPRQYAGLVELFELTLSEKIAPP